MNVHDIDVKHNPDQHRFEVQTGDQVAVLLYQVQGDHMVITQVEVPPAYEGRGIGSALARAGLDYALEHHLEVISLCPFVNAYMERHPEYKA